MSSLVEQQATFALEPLDGFVFLQSEPPPPYDAKQAVANQIAFSPSSPSTTAEGESEEIRFQEQDSELSLDAKPESQSALVVTSNRTYQVVHDFPAPTELGSQEVRIRNHATGLNHIDWKSVDYNFCLPELPWITGREMAGVVDIVGSEVSRFKVGDLVWTSKYALQEHFTTYMATEPCVCSSRADIQSFWIGTYYKDRRAGCFQDLVVVPEHTVFPVPTNLDAESAACLGVAALTAAMSLWKWLGVPMFPQPPPERLDEGEKTSSREVMLIWGGSTVTGQFAVQLAAQAGYEVIAVCSPSTHDLVASLGADHVVTYNEKTDLHLIGEVLCLAQGRLTKAVDLVGAKTANLVLQIIGACARGERHVDFAPLAFMSSKTVVPPNARVHTVEMKRFVLDRACVIYGQRLNELVEKGSLRLPKIRVLPGGLSAVEEGLVRVKGGKMGGEKLVVSFTS
jgi:NADPH:quinone reductase-like Zn-dependent oxidoreductase